MPTWSDSISWRKFNRGRLGLKWFFVRPYQGVALTFPRQPHNSGMALPNLLSCARLLLVPVLLTLVGTAIPRFSFLPDRFDPHG